MRRPAAAVVPYQHERLSVVPGQCRFDWRVAGTGGGFLVLRAFCISTYIFAVLMFQ